MYIYLYITSLNFFYLFYSMQPLMLIVIKIKFNYLQLDLIVSYIIMSPHEYKGYETRYLYVVVNSNDMCCIVWSASKCHLIFLTYLA